MTFEQYPCEAGQLVQLGLKDQRWGIVSDADGSYLWEAGGNGFAHWECKLILPSPRQCQAAGLTAWEALELLFPMQDDGMGDYLRYRYVLDGVFSKLELVTEPDRPRQLAAICFNDGQCYDPAALERAANIMRALQAWRAAWPADAAQEEV